MSTTTSSVASHRISGPGELLQAIPYLLGFHARASLVLVGLHRRQLVVTARLDLADAADRALIVQTVHAMHAGGTTEVLGVIFDDVGQPARRLPHTELASELVVVVSDAGCELTEVLLVSDGRWWSYACIEPSCCPPGGRQVPVQPSAFTAAATYAGVVALPDRDTLASLLEPWPDTEREALDPLIGAAEDDAVTAVLAGSKRSHERSVKRAIFAAARAADLPGWIGAPDATVARFVVALSETAVRDAIWIAIDDGRLDARAMWRDLARRAPAPYDAAALFLYGWAAWRDGDGASAGMAAERAVGSDPAYTAADLLLAALSHGMDPRRMPRLRGRRLPRSA